MAEQGQHADGGGATRDLIQEGGLHSVLRLAAHSVGVEDALLVAKALNALCQTEALHADMLQITASHRYDSVIRTLVKLERNAHAQSRMAYDQHGEVKREIWQALQSLATQRQNHTRLKSDGVGTLCAERCAEGALTSGSQSSEANSLGRQVLQLLDLDGKSAYRPAVQLASAQGLAVPHYWKPQNPNQQIVEWEIERGSWEWIMLEQQMNANIHQHGSRFGTVPGM